MLELTVIAVNRKTFLVEDLTGLPPFLNLLNTSVPDSQVKTSTKGNYPDVIITNTFFEIINYLPIMKIV